MLDSRKNTEASVLYGLKEIFLFAENAPTQVMKIVLPFLTALFCLVLASPQITNSQVREEPDKYSFFIFETFHKSNNTYYLVITAPVRNWHSSFSQAQKNDLFKNFSAQANKRAGILLMKNDDIPLPADGNYERYTSFSQCKKAVWRKMDEHEAKCKTSGTVYVIYVQPANKNK